MALWVRPAFRDQDTQRINLVDGMKIVILLRLTSLLLDKRPVQKHLTLLTYVQNRKQTFRKSLHVIKKYIEIVLFPIIVSCQTSVWSSPLYHAEIYVSQFTNCHFMKSSKNVRIGSSVDFIVIRNVYFDSIGLKKGFGLSVLFLFFLASYFYFTVCLDYNFHVQTKMDQIQIAVQPFYEIIWTKFDHL